MPPQPTPAQVRFNNVVTCLSTAMSTLEAVSESLKTPFLGAISNTMRSLLSVVQNVKRNKDDCTQMLEQIHGLLYAIISLHTNLDTGSELPPSALDNLGKFTETLYKLHSFVESQQDKNKIKQFFRQGELNSLLKGCKMGLEQALDFFEVQGVDILNDVTEMQRYAQKRHQEVMELISTLSDGGSSDRGSSISRVFSSAENSSNSLSLLPSEPKIFHGRDTEVSHIIQMFRKESPRIAILGTGGMGKTSLARAVLHHSEITAMYGEHRVFVGCDAASSSIQLASHIAAHVGLKPGKDLTRPVVRHFTTSPPCLLILDNLETIWEPRESRGEVEKFLCLLADVGHLALVITMRGAERPANVRWTHPFLEPLKPLTQEAARQTFIDIVDDGHSAEEVDKILLVTDNMPLAIDLIAHSVDYEGLSSVLHRWEMEKTSLLSEGSNKGSNLDLSISLSLASSRMRSLPQAQDLLSLLSILPDGISDTELEQSKVQIKNILACKATLLRISLAYMDDRRRLIVLVPIREYVRKMHPPVAHLFRPLLQYYHNLFKLFSTYHGTVTIPGIVARITTNFVNIQNILVKSLHQDNPEIVDAIYCTLAFDNFSKTVGYGQSDLLDLIPRVLPRPWDHRLEVYFITQFFAGFLHQPIPNADSLVDQTLMHFPHLDDSSLKWRFYLAIAEFYLSSHQDIPRATQSAQAGLTLARANGNQGQQSQSLAQLAWIKWQTGDYSAAQVHVYESQKLARISGDYYKEALALRLESMCWRSLGRYSTSLALCRRTTDLISLCGMSGGELHHSVISHQAEIHRLKSEYIEARNIHMQFAHKMEQDPYFQAWALVNLAQIDVETDSSKDEVQRNINTAISRFKMVGNSAACIACDATSAALSMREGDLRAAMPLFRKCLDVGWGRDIELESYCLERLGDFQRWATIGQTSHSWTVAFLVHSIQKKHKLEIYKALQFFGDVYLADCDQHTAISLFTVALEGFTLMDVHRSRAECMLRLGDIAKQDEDTVKAAEFWSTARPLFEQSSQTKQVALIDERLTGIRDNLRSLDYLLSLNVPVANPKERDVRPTNTTPSRIDEIENLVLEDDSGRVLVRAG